MTARIIATLMGLFFGGPLGALIGFFIGYFMDSSVHKNQKFTQGFQWRSMFSSSFIRSIFVLMGYLAKADGQVTSNEIQVASLTMTQLRLSDQQRHQAMRWFYEGKNHQFNLDEILQKLRLYKHTPLIKVLVACLTNIAYANGRPSREQSQILEQIAHGLGISLQTEQNYHHYHYQHTNTNQRPVSLAEDYALLGLTQEADVASIKKAYRRLMNKFHPDKIASKGASEKELKAANEKIYKIRQAYENVMHAKGEKV